MTAVFSKMTSVLPAASPDKHANSFRADRSMPSAMCGVYAMLLPIVEGVSIVP